ncbi:MAG TPA: Gmad2 immunoglobulin-like domain-containing protein, partial [Anaerolineales bacterium]|nr:Gmad2 immunoglobulin-like domain-containing protein [Anaerolineales bacterium]
MRKVVLWVLILILVWMLAACAPAAPQQDASQPAPTMPDEVESADDASPTSESPQTPPTETPLPEAFVEEKILIAAPGTNSSVTSPFVVEGLAVAPFESILGLRVTDANGVVLAEAYPQVNAQMGQTGPYQQEIVFSGVTEEIPGRLVVYTTSPRDGGLVHLSSVVIRLLPGGEAQISPSDGAEEKIQILSPAAGEAVSGGAITVTGNSAYFFEANLSLMLCAEGGSGSPHL